MDMDFLGRRVCRQCTLDVMIGRRSNVIGLAVKKHGINSGVASSNTRAFKGGNLILDPNSEGTFFCE